MPNTVMLIIMQKNGFTIIELLITIVIAGILLVATIPTMRHLITANRATAQVDHIVAALQYARSEAIKLGKTVKYCGSSDHINCDGKWNQGQIIATNNEIIRVFPTLPHGDKLNLNGGFGKDKTLEFTPLGTINGQAGSLYYCHKDQSLPVIRIIININGRIKIEKDIQYSNSKCEGDS